MNIQQLRESQQTQIKSFGKFTPLIMYVALSGEDAATAVENGISSVNDGVQHIISPSYKQAAALGDVVIPIQTTGEHIEIPEELSTRENVQKAHKMYPDSKDPLSSMVLLSDRPVAYFNGAVRPDQMNQELFITGYKEDGTKVDTGSERIKYPTMRFNRWYVSNVVIPNKRKRLQF